MYNNLKTVLQLILYEHACWSLTQVKLQTQQMQTGLEDRSMLQVHPS